METFGKRFPFIVDRDLIRINSRFNLHFEKPTNFLPTQMAAPPEVKVCVGNQEGTVASFSLATEDDGLLALEAEFVQRTHVGSVRALALDGISLLSGGTDENVRVYDVRKRRSRGVLTTHQGDVSALALFRDAKSRSHALSGDTTGALCIWRARDWRLLKTMRAHNSSILSCAAHPTGAIALSTSNDRTLFMWDLVRGKIVFSAKSKGGSIPCSVWSDNGDSYLLASGKNASLNSVNGQSVQAMPHPSAVADVAFVDKCVGHTDAIITGADDGVVRLWDSRAHAVQRTGTTHKRRIVNVATAGSLVISADVRGGLSVWDLRGGNEPRLETNLGVSISVMRCAEVVPEVAMGKRERAGKGENVEKGEANEEGDEIAEKDGNSLMNSTTGDDRTVMKTKKKKRRRNR